MAELRSQFFDGKSYSAIDFVETNKNIMRNGVIADKNFCKVTANGNMSVAVSPGRGWINGHSFQIENTLTFELPQADGILDRVDTIIIRLDLTVGEEKIQCFNVVGQLGQSFTEPMRDGNIYDIIIAKVPVTNGLTEITDLIIVDTRGDTTICGYAGALSSDEFMWAEKADVVEVSQMLEDMKNELGTADFDIQANKILGFPIAESAVSTGASLKFNGASWIPSASEYYLQTLNCYTSSSSYTTTYTVNSKFWGKPVLILINLRKGCNISFNNKTVINSSRNASSDCVAISTTTLYLYLCHLTVPTNGQLKMSASTGGDTYMDFSMNIIGSV